ncbi:MAG: M15 family metallopeptidase [Treponema sp.]|jgi:D-alanyl-D-alanine carboxypeptidase|nr:M15 family metallopeptidase [Treponema sp.]
MGSVRTFAAILLLFPFFSCVKQRSSQNHSQAEQTAAVIEAYFTEQLSTVLNNAQLPADISQKINKDLSFNPAFILDLFTCLQGDPFLRILVDKEHSLAEDYEPEDLVELKDSSYRTGRQGLSLRSAAAVALDEMAEAAKAEGITLTASSTYRSYNTQTEIYERVVRAMGREAADRESARPGHSQHQLGLTVDFGSITDAFAKTREGIWIAANASRFGWSLSYPDGYEEVTGYRWESWHYRYVGRELAEFIDNYFDGIQQYALKFIQEWENLTE